MGKFLVLQFFVYCCFRMLSSQMAAVWWFCDLCVLVVLEVSVCVCPKMTSHWILQVPDAASLLVQQRSAVLLRSAKKKKTFTLVCVLARKLARSAWLCSAEFVYRDCFFYTPTFEYNYDLDDQLLCVSPSGLRNICLTIAISLLYWQTCWAGQRRAALVVWLLQTRETKHWRYVMFQMKVSPNLNSKLKTGEEKY